MDSGSHKTKYHKLDFRRPVHFVLIAIVCISGLGTMGPHVLAQPLTLEDIVSSVDSAADTPINAVKYLLSRSHLFNPTILNKFIEMIGVKEDYGDAYHVYSD